MKTLALCFLTAVLFSSQLISAQTEASKNKTTVLTILQTKEGALQLPLNGIPTNPIVKLQPFNNVVQIQQIGKHNTFDLQLESNTSVVSVIQKGNNNTVLMSKQASSIEQKVLQLGNNNIIYDFASYSNFNVKSEFIQKGNNQTINSFGSNSISRDLKVIQSGNGSAVVLINNSKL